MRVATFLESVLLYHTQHPSSHSFSEGRTQKYTLSVPIRVSLAFMERTERMKEYLGMWCFHKTAPRTRPQP